MKNLESVEKLAIGLVVLVGAAVFLVCIATGHMFGIIIAAVAAIGYPIFFWINQPPRRAS